MGDLGCCHFLGGSLVVARGMGEAPLLSGNIESSS